MMTALAAFAAGLLLGSLVGVGFCSIVVAGRLAEVEREAERWLDRDKGR